GRRTLVPAKINDADAQFMLDSGAFWSTLTLAAARQYGLSVNYTQMPELTIVGASGSIPAGITTIRNFSIFGIPYKNVDFIVIGSEINEGSAGLIGQNLLRYADIDYDLGHGRVRLFITKECRTANLAYWVTPGDKLSVVKIESTDIRAPHTITTAYLNGERIRVMLDTGAPTSMVSLRAARRAGLTPDSAGVESGGVDWGLGQRRFNTWIGRFASFKIGDEEIQNARLRFADADLPTDMLLGADFFLSHRIMVSNSQDKLYITYAGGPVFDLRRRPSTPADDDQPKDAAGYAQRGGIYAARNMLDRALADLDRACELAPENVDYRLARARLRLRSGQFDQAHQDFDQVLKLQPANIEALLAHAAQDIRQRDYAAAAAGLDRLDQLVPQASEQRVELAQLNFAARRPEASIPQLDQWIALHPDDANLPGALNDRCWARALVARNGSDRRLDDALDDCNAALRRRSGTAAFLDSRGLVYLRKGKWDRAIDDYNAALAKRPKQAWSLYCRGVARIHKGLKADGQADIDAAVAADAHIADDAGYYGIAP
ncbi:MAG: aspartyl protease family protein, partial [Proteobacteria bacterium]|nr:aspartyl protease family protein [Pseudomonadota bacterium]